ncbi:MAG TPA: AsmA family protein [Usitatibacter sp.]|nr:AsmA family protein [Usitatibacter sp.]
MLMAKRIALIVLVVLLVPVLVLAAAILLVQSPWGERFAERQVGSRIERQVDLQGIRLHAAWPPVVSFQRIRISNPAWASTKELVDAEELSASVEVLPLFARRIIVPSLTAKRATAGLEQKGDQATWRFGGDSRSPSRILLERVALEDGRIKYIVAEEATDLDIQAKGTLGTGGEVSLAATGKYRGSPAKVDIKLPGLTPDPGDSIRFSGDGTVGATHASVEGTFATNLETYDLRLKLSGKSLKDLHALTGMVLPDTPPYNLAGRLAYADNRWNFNPFNGKVGDSDLRGQLAYTKGKKPLLQAKLESKLLDFNDLGPLIGAPPGTGAGETASPEQQAKKEETAASTRILPDEPFSTQRWGEMNADVTLKAARVLRPKQLPVDSLSTHLVLDDSVLRLEPLDFGVASGAVRTHIVIDARQKPPAATLKGDVDGLDLGKLFPTVKSMQEALGHVYGRADLKGRGASVAQLLGTSSGTGVLAANGGRVSDLLVQLLEIDVAQAAMLLGSHRQADLRCAVGDLEVKDGVVTPKSFIVDTTETFVKVEGNVDLAHEKLDIVTKGQGKTPSAFVLRAPVEMVGPLKKPKVHPKAGPIVAQVGAAVALAAVNPALAIAPFVDPGKKKDADCDKLLAEARNAGASGKTKTAER